MKGFSICRRADAPTVSGHPIIGHGISGQRVGDAVARLLHPDGYSLWMVELDLPAGAELALPAEHGDEIVYVSSGEIAVDGRVCRAGGAAVVESGARPSIVATEPTVVLHMGPTDAAVPTDGLNGPITRRPSEVHVVGPRGWLAIETPGRLSKYYADSTCDGCRATLLYTSREEPYVSPAHSHSVDELIHVVWGEIRLGAHRLTGGDTLAVPADQRYGFRADGGFGFLNYRRDASEQTIALGEPPLMEGGLVNGFQLVGELES